MTQKKAPYFPVASLPIDSVWDGKYRITAKLGAGGFGVVYRAVDELAGRDVAIKLLRQTDFADQDNLIWEIQQLAQLAVPNVVTFYHHFEASGGLFLVMEYCEGGSLADVLRLTPMNEQDATRLAVRLATSMQRVHDAGVVHHDIKPANILLTAGNEPRISDFGVANRHAGTLSYMAPEQFLGDAISATDVRIDIYALTLTLLETMIASNPFDGLSRSEALQAKATQSFVPLSLPDWLREIILRGTHPTPERRFQTMTEFRQALIAKRVPMVMSKRRIEVHRLAEKGGEYVRKKKWSKARTTLSQALESDPGCLLAVVTAGKLELMLNNREKAAVLLMRAAEMSPRVAIQKELGTLYLLEKDYPRAISMLVDYLDRNATDFEAHNVLMQCYFEMGRYDAADELGLEVSKQRPGNDCFECNRFLSRLLDGKIGEEFLDQYDSTKFPPFLRYNLVIAKEGPIAWSNSGRPPLKSKLLWHDYRFGSATQKKTANDLVIQLADGYRYCTAKPIVTIGQLALNEVPLKGDSISRRHAAILNWPDDVWICDLGSTRGVYVDGERIDGRRFLDGVHEIRVGNVTMQVSTSGGLLI